MKKYIDAKLEIVSMSNDIIATSAQLGINSGEFIDEQGIQVQGRRNIWD